MLPEIELWNGEVVPRIGMGCWAIGGPFFTGESPVGYGDADDRATRRGIHAAADLGVRLFDTADVYGAGHSEVLLGEALGGRLDVLIATKYGYRFDPETKQMPGEDASPDYTRRAVEASLRRLKRDRIDLLFLHLNELPIDEAAASFDAVERLCAEGKVGAFGWSTDFPGRIDHFASRERVVAVQHRMNLFFDAPSMKSVVEQAGLVSFARSPLAMGVLTGKFRAGKPLPAGGIRSTTLDWMAYFKDGQVVSSFVDRLDSVKDLLQTDGRTLAQGALAWILANSPRTVPIPGFRNAAQVEENVGALHKGPLPADVMTEIERIIDRQPEEEPRAA